VISLSVGAAIRVVSGTRDVFTGGGVSAPGDLWRGVALELSNLQVLCQSCNEGKSNIFEDSFKNVLEV